MQALVTIQSVIVDKSESYGDWFGLTGEPGSSAEWDLRFNVAGQVAALRHDDTTDGSVITVNRQFLVDLSQNENLRIEVSGWEIDDTSANDPLPRAEYTIVPSDHWTEGQTFTFAAPSHQDFAYRVVFDIRSAEKIGSSNSALSVSESTPLVLGAAISLDPDQLNILTTGSTGGTYLASWNQYVADANWQGWTILNLPIGAASSITAVSRDPGWLDIFVVGKDNCIYNADWCLERSGGWQGWWRVLDGVAAPNTSVGVVSRAPGWLDMCVVGTDGGIYNADWSAERGEEFEGWWRVLDAVAAPNSSVSVVSRALHWLDMFIIGADGGIYTASWHPDFGDQFHGWWRIGDVVAAPNTSVSAVSRAPNKMDIFVVGQDGYIWTAAWDTDVDEGEWRGWWRVL